jgi:hypothetical protein
MDYPEKNRLAKTVVDRWCCFQEALCETKRKYPTQEFLSFAQAARSYIDLTRHDQLIHSAAEPQPKHFGKLSAVSAQLSALAAEILLPFCNLPK